MKKAIITAGIVTALSAAGLAGVSVANAATTTGTHNGPFSGLVDALVSKFNLNESEVQAVFDAQRETMEAERDQEAKDRLAQLVTDGKLTQAQADKITAKRTEVEAEREANRTSNEKKTTAERKAEMENHKATLDTWLSDNGIDEQYTYLLSGGGGHGRGYGGPTSSTTSTDQ